MPLAEANEHLSSELHLMDMAATRDFVDTILSLWERNLNKRYTKSNLWDDGIQGCVNQLLIYIFIDEDGIGAPTL